MSDDEMLSSDSPTDSEERRSFMDGVFANQLFSTEAVGSSQHTNRRYPPMPKHMRPFTGGEKVEDILSGHPERSYELFRMFPDGIHRLNDELTALGYLQCHRYVGTEEQICMFLYTIAHGLPNRVVAEEFQHSTQTVFKHFHGVLRALIDGLQHRYIRLPSADERCHPIIASDSRFYPYFAGALGAIDGTYIPAIVRKSKHNRYCCRKQFIAQNVMVACSFDERFLFVASGVEGSAADMQVLHMCLENGSFSVPEGRYYLVDGGYANTHQFLAPFRGNRYHLNEFSGQRRYRNPRDMFNHRHAQLRNCVKRTFGIVKRKFKILRYPQPFKFSIQADIVIACCILHNFMRTNSLAEEDLSSSSSEEEYDDDDDDDDDTEHGRQLREEIMAELWNSI